MKKHLIKVLTLLVFASVSLTSCSLEYRQHRREQRGHDHDHDHDRDHNRNYHNYHN